MQDSRKTRAQLIEELQELRVLLGKNGPGGAAGEGGRTPRWELRVPIEFIGDFDVVEARGVDLSAGGICFEISGAFPFEMRFEAGGEKRQCRAHLVWMKSLPGDRYRLGFQFVPPESFPVI